MRRIRNQKRRIAAGFTILEVMMAMGIVAAGAVAIIGLQVTALRANEQARRQTQASAIAREWADRIRRDGARFRRNAGATGVEQTQWLSQVVPQNGLWLTPAVFAVPPAGVESVAYDHNGRPTAAGVNTRYCVNVRFTWADGNAGATTNAAVRAEVRVAYPRDRVDQNWFATYAGCAPGAITAELANGANAAIGAAQTSFVIHRRAWTP